jgi:pSer/pThr/pTyr-binding forkhead associated (FHA) protein
MSDSPARLVLLLPNGQEGGTYPLKPDKTVIGRQQGNILFLDDPYVSPIHATFIRTPDGGMTVRDEKSLNGLFFRLRERMPLEHNDVLLIGKQLFLFEKIVAPPPDEDGFDLHSEMPSPVWGSPYTNYWGRVMQMISGGKKGNAILLGGEHVDFGRERGQITFPGDRYISAIHARIAFLQGQYTLEDLGSRNGTFLRINKERPLKHNDVLIIGEQLLRIEFL